MPAKVDAPLRKCAKCGREGTQRFEKDGRKYVCTDAAACLKRAAKRDAAKVRAKTTKATKVGRARPAAKSSNGRARRATAKAKS